MTNYYQVLGVAPDASDQEIRMRFRILARTLHPDRFLDETKKKEAEVRFQLLTEAVNILMNPARRKAHDFGLGQGSEAAVHDPQAVAKVYLAKGVKAYREADFGEALAMFDMSVQHYNKDPKALHYLAMTCQKVPGQARKGADAIEMAIKLDAHNASFYRDAAKLYLMVGLKAKAERHLEEVLRWLPDDPEAQRLMSEIRKPADSKTTFGGIFGRKG